LIQVVARRKPKAASRGQPAPAALAIGAHPDDIEFYMAGTLLLLKEAGVAIHYLNVASGSCGSLTIKPPKLRRIRRGESQRAASLLGAAYHPSLVDDLEIFYDLPTLRKLAAIVRAVRPAIVLTHSPQDYMEDHTNTCRLAVTAAFARGMPNFRTTPSRDAVDSDVTVYHAMPHSLHDPLRRPILPDLFVNTASVHAVKRDALAAHESQRAWLDASQGMDSYLAAMDDLSRAVGKMSQRFEHAEGWRRHLHFGFSAKEIDPLQSILGDNYLENRKVQTPNPRE
jgi:N-acetylglucosamine malate deacetylase 1